MKLEQAENSGLIGRMSKLMWGRNVCFPHLSYPLGETQVSLWIALDLVFLLLFMVKVVRG